MIILGPKTAILGPLFCRILVLGPQFWWSGGPGPPGPLDPPLLYQDIINIIKETVPFSELHQIHMAKNVIRNYIHPNSKPIENFLFLVAKYHVYRKRCAGLLPNPAIFKSKV